MAVVQRLAAILWPDLQPALVGHLPAPFFTVEEWLLVDIFYTIKLLTAMQEDLQGAGEHLSHPCSISA